MTEETTTVRKSVRLNRTSREDILASIMDEFERNFFANSKTGCASKQEIVDRMKQVHVGILRNLWNRKYGHLREHIDQLPAWMVGSGNFYVFATNEKCFSDYIVGYPGKQNAVDLRLEEAEWDSVWEPYTALRDVRDLYDKEYKSFRQEVWTVLESCSSTKQLLEVWPKAEPYLPAYLDDPNRGINLPALQISRLEERLYGVGA